MVAAARTLPFDIPATMPVDSTELSPSVSAFITMLGRQLAHSIVAEVRAALASERVKEWYNTDELAEAVGKAPFTVREKWCNSGRIECEKDPATGKWRIPGAEYTRLVNGGALKPRIH